MKQSPSATPPVEHQLPPATVALLRRAADRIRPTGPAPAVEPAASLEVSR